MSARRTIVLLSTACTIAFMLGVEVARADPTWLGFTIWMIGLTWVVAPLVMSKIHQHVDILEPIWLVAAAMFAMFFLRPLALVSHGIYFQRGYNFRDTMPEAALLALAASLVFVLAYAAPISRTVGKAMAPLPASWYSSTVILGAIALILLGSTLYGAFIMQSGGLRSLFWIIQGREQGQDALFRGSSGYLYQGQFFLIPAGLLLFATGYVENRNRLKLAGLCAAFPVFLLNVGGSSRLYLMIMLSGFVIFWLLWNNKRPSILLLICSGYLLLTVGIGFLGGYRNLETRSGSVWTELRSYVLHPERSLDRITIGGDTDMFDTLALIMTVVPEKLPFQHGSVFRDPFIRMIPRQFWQGGKPLEANDQFLSMQWPDQYALHRAGPASSFLGQLYQDSGWPSVMIGMTLLGLVLRALWVWRIEGVSNPANQLFYAAVIPYTLVLLRGTLTHVLSTAVFTVLPLLLVLMISGKTIPLSRTAKDPYRTRTRRQSDSSVIEGGTTV